MLEAIRNIDSVEQYRKLPFNTQIVGKYNTSISELKWISPKKINTRLAINQLGLNGLATTIVAPEVVKEVDINFLKDINDFSNGINEKIGLPKTDSLIVRTSNSNGYKFSEPAMLVINTSSNHPNFKLMGDNVSYKSPEEFFANLKPNTYLLIHDDNEYMQYRSLQGRFGMVKNGSYELFITTDVLHPRDVLEKGEIAPNIKIHTDYLQELETYNVYQAAKYFKDNSSFETPRMEVFFKYCEQRKANFMLTKLTRDFLMLKTMREKVTEIFGENTAMEFRSYNILEGGIGQKIHVLDVN